MQTLLLQLIILGHCGVSLMNAILFHSHIQEKNDLRETKNSGYLLQSHVQSGDVTILLKPQHLRHASNLWGLSWWFSG